MRVPYLYRQVQGQLSQWINPADQHHLQVFCENIAAILQAQSACLSNWLPYVSHRDCEARSHMERLNYFVHNPKINAETFYYPLVEQFLKAWQGMEMTLVLDTSVLWDKYCLIEVCLIWGGRSIPLGQSVLEHGSATVGYEDYRRVLETTLRMLPAGCQVRLLADRGFEHGAFIRWLRDHRWSWAIRAKSDLGVAELGYDKFIVRAPKNNTSKNAELMKCPECQSTHVNKNGQKKGKQNYICVGCGRQFIDCYQPHKGYSEEVKREGLKMYVNGMGFRAIERIKGVHHTSIINWVKLVGELLRDAYEPETIPLVGELDELETFVGQKK